MKKVSTLASSRFMNSRTIIEPRTQLAVVRVGVRLVLHEAEVGAGVAAAAGSHQIGLVDGRCRDRTRAARRARRGNPSSEPFRHSRPASPAASGRCRGRWRTCLCGSCRRSAWTACGTPTSVGCRIACAVWQSVQTGAFILPPGDRLAVHALFVIGFDFGVAGAAGFGDVRLVGRALRIGVAENLVRAVAALAVGRHQQAFLAEREPVNRIDVVRVDAGQSMLARHAVVAVALAAGLGHVKRINGRARVGLGKDFVRIAVAARARMLFAVGMHAAFRAAPPDRRGRFRIAPARFCRDADSP